MNRDPSEIIAEERMGAFQIAAVVICVLLNAVDGFDVLSISFASPGIAADWGVDRAALGLVLSMELIGMALGSVLIGGLADRIGRRPIIILCLLIMAAGMIAAAFAHDVVSLSAYRLATGLGIGGMLASVNAIVAEYSNDKRRHLCVTIMAAGFPIGAVAGGAVASQMLNHYSWHAVFLLGAGFTLALLPVVLFMLPESVAYLAKARPKRALERINSTLKRMGHPTVDALPQIEARAVKAEGLFSKRWRSLLALLTIAYFAHIMAFYYILKWIPKIVADMGFSPPLAGGVLVWANVGGAIGAVVLGLFSQRFDVKWLVAGALVASAGMLTVFGLGYETLAQLSFVAAAAGFCTNAAVVGLYALMASYLPTEVRAGGTGFVIGMGRGGAALGPVVAGVMFAAGSDLLQVSVAMAGGSVLALAALIALRKPQAI
ncbi:MFS transporter [Vitreimonas sp.]|uniref:MFS transporter n=1 Tax=Vitreimonas sp. TaxID=3069702 RepID=UPI002ED9B217